MSVINEIVSEELYSLMYKNHCKSHIDTFDGYSKACLDIRNRIIKTAQECKTEVNFVYDLLHFGSLMNMEGKFVVYMLPFHKLAHYEDTKSTANMLLCTPKGNIIMTYIHKDTNIETLMKSSMPGSKTCDLCGVISHNMIINTSNKLKRQHCILCHEKIKQRIGELEKMFGK
jgi:hypothetical protein